MLRADAVKDLLKTIEGANSTASTFYTLFETVKDLQDTNLKDQIAELDEANARRLEAVVALARHVAMHKEKCAEYERKITVMQHKSQQSLDIVQAFVHENLADALDKSPQAQIEDVLRVFMHRNNDITYSAKHVPGALFDEVQKALNEVASERDELRDICNQQATTVHEQSHELDTYISRMAKVIGLIQEKEKVNGKLERENEGLRKDLEALTDAVRKQKVHDEKIRRMPSDGHAFQGYMDDDIWARDAEIMNLRRKLEQAFYRERQLDNQLKQFVQSSQSERLDKRPNRLKRLLTGNSYSQEHPLMLPKGNSMLDLSYAAVSISNKSNGHNGESYPLTKTARPSPTTAAFYADDQMYAPDLLLPRNLRDERSSIDLPPRFRSTFDTQQPHSEDIETAVSSRFQMPVNVRSTVSTPRPLTPKSQSSSSNSIPFEELQNYSRSCAQPGNSKPVVGIPRSASMLFAEHDFTQPATAHQRVLSGITEVSETGTTEHKRNSQSLDSVDKKMYRDSLAAFGNLDMR